MLSKIMKRNMMKKKLLFHSTANLNVKKANGYLALIYKVLVLPEMQNISVLMIIIFFIVDTTL